MKDTKDMTLEEKIEHYELLLREKDFEYQFIAKQSELSRARSYSVGGGAGGCVELSLRGVDGKNLFIILQPPEVSEAIHTLAAAIGCYAALKPREDFASWRNWALSPEERVRLFNDPSSSTALISNGKIGLENNLSGVPINNEMQGLRPSEE